MSDVTVPYAEAGLASFEQLDTHLQQFLLSGDHPRLASYPMRVKADQVLRQHEVVGLDANGELVPATNLIQPIGVMTQAVVGNAAGTTTVPTWYSGCFNPDALIWDASFATDEDKATAFNGAPTPTQITVRKRQGT